MNTRPLYLHKVCADRNRILPTRKFGFMKLLLFDDHNNGKNRHTKGSVCSERNVELLSVSCKKISNLLILQT